MPGIIGVDDRTIVGGLSRLRVRDKAAQLVLRSVLVLATVIGATAARAHQLSPGQSLPSQLPSAQARQEDTQQLPIDGFAQCVDQYGNPVDCTSGSVPFRSDTDAVTGSSNALPGRSAQPGPDYLSTNQAQVDAFGNPLPPIKMARKQTAEPLTEFQRYVAASIKQVLPIFGASLFEQVPATFAPVDRVPVSPDYVIGPGDELQVTVWGQINFSRRIMVDRLGEVYVPSVGQVAVTGLRFSEAPAVIKSRMERVYRNFDVSIAMGRLRSIQVFIVGEARRPGSYTVSSLSTLVNAVFASGGPSSRGTMRKIELRRGDQVVCDFDLYDLLVNGDKSKDVPLAPGDVILIPAAGPRVAIAGSIGHPGIYELKSGTTFEDVLRLAGGLSPIAAAQEAVLERVAEGQSLEVRRISLDRAGLATELRNGDIIRLLPVVPRFENAVTLRGNVADAGRYAWHSGMKISDLIPSKEALLTRDYWTARNQLEPGSAYPGSQSKGLDSVDAVSEESSGTITTLPPSPSLENASLINPQSPGGIDGTRIRYRDQSRKLQADSSLGAATGLDDVPPLRTFIPRNIVQPSAPEINWDYAVIERLDTETLTTQLIPFNLGRVVLKHDVSADIQLQRGDVVTIFSKADFSVPRVQQTMQVRLEGEIRMAGMYTALPGETLRHLVIRAGGLTSNAYLYGAQFTRESTRREQQKRYDEFLNQLERDVNQGAANLSGRVISTEQAATAQASVQSQRQLIDQLRQVPIDGRIVLELAPSSKGVDALPDLALENGDRFYIPSRPSTVNVVGSVFEQAAFLYDEDLHVGDYLKKAGGSTRSADRSHMFVIRADGSVVARSASVGMFDRGFDSLRMHPGDTLVVPTYVNKTTFVRGLMDWSQIFSNLALGAAAINVLH